MSLEEHAMQVHRRGGSKKQLLKEQLRLQKRQMPEGKERYEIVPVADTLSFEKGFFLFIRAVQLLAQENEGVILVGLAGPSGAGKTVFSEKVVAFMPSVSLISMDNYNVASRVIDGNFDDPRITDYDLLLQNLDSLRKGEPAEVPIYDFKTSSRIGTKTVAVPKSRVVMLEGIYALSERLRPFLDLRVSITGGVHFDLVKRVLRDIDRSGQAPEEIIAQISETVYPMYKAFIEPDLETAHLRIVNNFNPFSGFQDATYILKAPADMGDEAVKGVLSPETNMNTEETYDIYLLPPGEDKETCVSYLRMRNRDGRYSLMFEEWVTDGPFVITPRITFEVSVRLLGGLMALGYEIAHIVKRVSKVFKDPQTKVTVKLDHLEQLGKDYVQVQGKDRAKVKESAEKLGMEGKYIAKPYIEQILLDNLSKEVQAPKVAKAVKERFKLPEDFLKVGRGGKTLVTPRGSLPSFGSWSEPGVALRNLKQTRSDMSQGSDTIFSRQHGHDVDTTPLSPMSSSSGRDHAPSRDAMDMSQAHNLPPSHVSFLANSTRDRDKAEGALALSDPAILGRLEALVSKIEGVESRISASTPRALQPLPGGAPLTTPTFNGASASALSTQIPPNGHSFPNGNLSNSHPFPNGHAPNGNLSNAHAFPNGHAPNGSVNTSPVASMLPPPAAAEAAAGGRVNGGGHVFGGSPMDLIRSAAAAGNGARPSFDLQRGVPGVSSIFELLEEVRLLARNQSRVADELETLNGMLRQTLELGGVKVPGVGGGSNLFWRLELVMGVSALVSLTCASAMLFALLKHKT